MAFDLPLGGSWSSRPQDNFDKEYAAQLKAMQDASKGHFSWDQLDDKRKDFTGAKSVGPSPDQGTDLTRWMYFRKMYAAVDGFTFKDAEWIRGNGGSLTYVNTDFSGANLTGTDFTGATFKMCTFDSRTKMDEGNFKMAQFIDSPTAALASFKDAEFEAFAFVRDPKMGNRNSAGID